MLQEEEVEVEGVWGFLEVEAGESVDPLEGIGMANDDLALSCKDMVVGRQDCCYWGGFALVSPSHA